ncbi:peroxiredoxin family protein [Plantactinospora soyae]|uniref:Peroxiredoxin n=1 Tax=Plantactinospora soyae TaxID=1544732 RepID=A0A927MAS7_9ACTN|nr:redoxin domain-containing protein [Plantactinospora soyae]MBE1491064.1 peroxiredoxin [Plantactinospora soyae]
MPTSTLFSVSYGVLWLIVLAQTYVLLKIIRGRGISVGAAGGGADRPAEPLPAGSPAPDFKAPQLGQAEFLNSHRLRGNRVLLAFVGPDCFVCARSTPALQKISHVTEAKLILVCLGPADRCTDFVARYAPTAVALHDETGALAQRFRASKTPAAVLLDEAWRILQYGAPVDADGQWKFSTPPKSTPDPVGQR